MATVSRVTLTCDVCGDAENVTTRAIGLDGKAYEIDLCRRDGTALERAAARYIAKARKVSTGPGHRPARQRSDRTGAGAATTASGDGARAAATKVSSRGRVTGSQRKKAETSPSQRRAAADVRMQKGIYVYGILPGDIEVAEDTPGVGEHAGPLRDIHFDGLAALISDADTSGRQGSPEDLKTYREILDAIAAEVPVVPLRFGTILTSEDAVTEELLGARHDEFTAALEQLEGRAEFQVRGRYVTEAAIEVVTAWREQDTRALRDAMEGVCAASVARQPAGELDAVNVAFLVDADEEREMERVVEELASEWEGRIELQLLGPMAAYDFTGTAQPES